MIVVGCTHRGAIGRVVVGSTAEKLLSGAPCAVTVPPCGAAAGQASLATIGVGFDGSDEASDALHAAVALAERADATVQVISVVEKVPKVWAKAGYDYHHEVEADLLAEARRRLDTALAEVDGARVEGELVEGDPEEVLEQRSADLDFLVLGSRNYGPVERVFLGSVAKHLVHTAHCPVEVVPRGARVPAAA